MNIEEMKELYETGELSQQYLKEKLSYDKDTGIFTWKDSGNKRSNKTFAAFNC